MKYIINNTYGGFGVNDGILKLLGLEELDDTDLRTNPTLIDFIEKYPNKADEDYADLIVVTIPDNATDWELDEYDGWETLRYVADGKIHYAEAEEDDE